MNHNIKILTKDKPRPEDVEEIERNKKAHERIMQEKNKDTWVLNNSTWQIVTQKIKEKDKKVYNMFNRAEAVTREPFFNICQN